MKVPDGTLLEANFQRLQNIVRQELLSYQDWTRMLETLQQDRVYGDKIYAGAMCAPAGKGNHHYWRGGWVEHVLEMWDIYNKWCDCGMLDRRTIFCESYRVLKIIIAHDLHKTFLEFIYKSDVKEGDDYLFDYGDYPYKKLLTPDLCSLHILNQFNIKFDAVEMNALANSEGGWCKNPTKFTSVLAKLVYLTDEMSSNVLSRIKDQTSLNVRVKDSSETFGYVNPFQSISKL